MRTVLAGALALAAGVVCAQIAVANEAGLTVYPAESVPFAYSKQLLVRFDLACVRNAEKIRKATLSLSGSSPLPVAVEIRPITTQWGGATAAFRKRESEGVWRKQDLERHGYQVCGDLFRLGDPIGEWASLDAKKWPARWAGESVVTIQSGGVADVTALVKRWAAEPGENFGVLLKLAAEAGDAYLGRHAASLRLEGDGLTLEETIRLADRPAWLPKGYRVQHPRLPYPTKRWLAALKADPKRLAALCKIADRFDPSRGRAADVKHLVLAQKLNPTPARAEVIRRAIDAPFPNHGNYAKLYGLAVLYDWGYDLLAPADRGRLAARIERMCTNEEMGSSSTIISPYNDVGTSRFGCGLLWGAIAIYPDIPAARKHLFRAKAYYIDTTIPVWHQILGDHGGYWHELHGYYLSTCLGNSLARLLSAWSSATGEDLYAANPWLEHMLYFAIHSTRPDRYRIRMGDIKCDERAYGEAPIVLQCFPALTQRYDNPHGRWWLRQFGGTRFDGLTPTEDPWGEPFAAKATFKSEDTLPTAYHADGLGVVNMRSDWSEDATYIWFKCGPNFWSHSHLDSGSFAIYKRGALAIDAGNYTAGHNCEHYLEYGKQSIAHNVVTVTDPDEPPCSRGSWSFPNDGGQRFVVAGTATAAPYSVAEWEKRRDDFDTGRIVAFQSTNDFTYVCGDVTKAYTNSRSGTGHAASRSKRVRRMLRSLLYLPPDHVVVFDQVASFNKDFKKRWLLHTINEPTVEGNLVTVERADTAFRFNGWDKRLKHAIRAPADHPFFKAHPDCRFYGGYQPQLYQYDGVMFVRTLLPKRAEVVKVGGEGKQCWVAGRNRIRNTRGKPISIRPHTGEGETGSWRIEISPAEPAEEDRFLNVIQLGTKSARPTPTAAKLVDAKDATAVQVDLAAGRRAIITFNEGLGGHIRIEQGGRPVVDRPLGDRVEPGPKIVK